MAMEIACRIPNAHALPILCVAYNQDRKEIFSGSEDTKIKVFDIVSTRVSSSAWISFVTTSLTVLEVLLDSYIRFSQFRDCGF